MFFSCQNKNKESIPTYKVLKNYSSDSLLPKNKEDIYVFFENDFLNDTIDVFSNGNLIYSNNISTDYSLGLAKAIKVGKTSSIESIVFKINKGDEVEIKDHRYLYMNINYIRDSLVEIDYTNKVIPYE